MPRITFALATMLSFMAFTPVAAQDLQKGLVAAETGDYGAETAKKESGISEKAEYAKIQNVISNAVVSGDLRLAAGLFGNRNGELFNSTFELIENKNKVAEKRDVIINIASMTKLITTIAVLQLVEQGKIDLDKEINVYLPELSNLKILEGFEKKEPILLSSGMSNLNELSRISHKHRHVYLSSHRSLLLYSALQENESSSWKEEIQEHLGFCEVD